MADRKITDLTALAAGSQATGDLVTIVDVSESAAADKNKKMTVENFFKGIPGQVGIGTTPSNALHVEKNNSSADLVFLNNTGNTAADVLRLNTGGTGSGTDIFDAQAGGTSRFLVRGDGNVGVGETSPAAGLDVKVDNNPVLAIDRGSANTANFNLQYNGTLTGQISAANADFQVSAVGSSTPMSFYVNGSERSRIDSSGRLLVGTTSALDTTAGAIASNNSTSGGRLALGGNPSGAGSSVGEVFGWWNGNKVAGLVAASGADTTNKDDGELLFYTSASGPSVQERMRIDRSGNVGIGDNAPGHRLVVKDAGASNTSNYLNVISGSAANAGIAFGDTNADLEGGILYNHTDDALRFFKNGFTEAARIDSSGRLLVGATSARTNFNNSTIGANIFQVERAGNALASAISVTANSGTLNRTLPISGAARLILSRSTGTSLGSNNIVANGDVIGDVSFQGNDDGGFVEAAAIQCFVDGTPGTNDMPGRIVFKTTGDGADNSTERARITKDGYFKASNNGTYISTASYHEFNQSNNEQMIFSKASHASFTENMIVLRAVRANTSAYNFLICQSNNGSDSEFVLRGDGNGYADGSWNGGGADYAEFFEWSDGNAKAEDRRGISVVLDGDKIRKAVTGEEPIGVISGNPSVVGDADIDRWKGKYLRDDYGTYIQEDYEVEDDDGNTVVQQRRKLNPDYDPDTEYVTRENRPEWDTVGLMGKLRIRKGQVTGTRWIKMRDVSDTVEEWLVR